jgi:hypothetical protein
MLYTTRGHFPEYDVLVEEMPKYVRSAFFSHDDLFNGKWETHLDKLLAQPKLKKKPRPMAPTWRRRFCSRRSTSHPRSRAADRRSKSKSFEE